MSTMPGNPHHADADGMFDTIHDWQSDEGITDATMIAVTVEGLKDATLALAYEQRTANLIAFLSEFGRDFTGVPSEVAQLWFKQVQAINERLGIEGE